MVMEQHYDYPSLIPALREAFLERFAEKISEGVYDDRDLERIKTDDGYTKAFIDHGRGQVDSTAGLVNTTLKWRKDMAINDLNKDFFPIEFHERGALYYHNYDKDGHKILYFQVKAHKKDSERVHLNYQYIAWWLEKHQKKHPEEQIVVLFDMTDAGLSNVDIDLLKFQISCFTTYFPHILAYMLIYEMPWVLNAVWKIVKAILTAEQQRAIRFVKRNEIQEYVNKDQLWEHMGGTDTYKYVYKPDVDQLDSPTTNNSAGKKRDTYKYVYKPDVDQLDSPTTNNSAGKKRDTYKYVYKPDVDQLDSPTTNNSAGKKRVTFAEQDPNMYRSFSSDSIQEMDTPNKPGKRSLNISSRKTPREDSTVFNGPLLTINPGEVIEFEILDPTKETVEILKLSNPLKKQVAYKVKTTAPEKFRVRSSTGIIKPSGSVDIQVYLHPGHADFLNKDKFLVMAIEVADHVRSVGDIPDLWKTANREKLMEHRLRCGLASVKGSLSPVSFEESHAQKSIDQLAEKMNHLLQQNVQLERQVSLLRQTQWVILILVVIIAIIVACIYKADPTAVINRSPSESYCRPYPYYYP